MYKQTGIRVSQSQGPSLQNVEFSFPLLTTSTDPINSLIRMPVALQVHLLLYKRKVVDGLRGTHTHTHTDQQRGREAEREDEEEAIKTFTVPHVKILFLSRRLIPIRYPRYDSVRYVSRTT